jgi:hypothetical protein
MPIVSLGSIASNLLINPYASLPAPSPAGTPVAIQSGTDYSAPTAADSSSAGALPQTGTQQQAALQNSQAILATGRRAMSNAMQTFATDWEAAKTRIASERPDLLDKHWDIETDQGVIVVESNSLSQSDVGWLTGMLNQNASLVADTQNLNNIMVSTFGGTAAMAAADPLGITLSALNEGNIDGKVNFLSLLAGADYESYQTFDTQMPNNLALAMKGSNSMNLPTVGQIGAISSLDALTVTKDHRQYQIQANKGMQQTAYADTLNVAFQQFLSPQFASSSVTDGTDAAPASSPHAELIASLIGAVNNSMGAMTSLSNNAVALTTQVNGADDAVEEQGMASLLGASYRSYGEAATPVQEASGPADTATGAGSVGNLYDEKDAVLTPTQESILGPMQSFGADWETSKKEIAAVRPDLLSDNWDFISDDGAIQATSANLTQEETLWLTGKLNQNSNLIADTQAINLGLVDFYRNQFANDTNPLDAVANYADPTKFDLSHLTPQDIDGRINYLALMGGENPTQELVQSKKNGLLLSAAG